MHVGWSNDVQFDSEQFEADEEPTSDRYARISIYANTSDVHGDEKSGTEDGELILETSQNQDLLLPLAYFFGDDPVAKAEQSVSEEKVRFDDVLLGQTIIELPNIHDDKRAVGNREKFDSFFRSRSEQPSTH